jgi:hypothetical protein
MRQPNDVADDQCSIHGLSSWRLGALGRYVNQMRCRCKADAPQFSAEKDTRHGCRSRHGDLRERSGECEMGGEGFMEIG